MYPAFGIASWTTMKAVFLTQNSGNIIKKENQMDMHHKGSNTYAKLGVMVILSFISMYILMYAMVDTFSNVIPNINQFYMAALMTLPMVIIEVVLMGSMYTNRKLNFTIITLSFVLLVAFFFFIRQQSFVSDKQFLRSMIPHHASALLMCEKTNLQDPELKDLCASILSGQQDEIDQMKAKLETLK